MESKTQAIIRLDADCSPRVGLWTSQLWDPRGGPETPGEEWKVIHQNVDKAFIFGWHEYFYFAYVCILLFSPIMDTNLLYQNFFNI